jgi:hypothetical protein
MALVLPGGRFYYGCLIGWPPPASDSRKWSAGWKTNVVSTYAAAEGGDVPFDFYDFEKARENLHDDGPQPG